MQQQIRTIDVPWKKAEAIRDQLVKRGVEVTVCFEPNEHAFLELHDQNDTGSVNAILAEFGVALAV